MLSIWDTGIIGIICYEIIHFIQFQTKKVPDRRAKMMVSLDEYCNYIRKYDDKDGGEGEDTKGKILYDNFSYNMCNEEFTTYLLFLSTQNVENIYIENYPTYTIYNLLFSNRFFIFTPPKYHYIYTIENKWYIKLLLTFYILYTCPVILFFTCALFCLDNYIKTL